jgi:hypothetical protein
MKWQSIFKLVILTVVFMAFSRSALAEEKPNIVLIFMDNLAMASWVYTVEGLHEEDQPHALTGLPTKESV